MVVSTKVAPARNLGLAAGPFVETATGRVLQVRFCLSAKPRGSCLPQHSLPENSQEMLWLRPEGTAQVGSYAGTVRLLAGNGLETSKQLTLDVSSDEWRLWGLAALVAGVILSFFMTVLLPHQRERDLSVRPFLLLRERLRKSERSIAQVQAPELKKRTSEVAEQLSTTTLQREGHIQSAWPSSSPQTTDATALKAHFDELQAKVAAIELISDAVTSAPDDATRTAVDRLAASRDFEKGDLPGRINNALGVPGPAQRRGPAEVTPAVLVFREEMRNMTFWLVSSAIGIALGYILLVDSDAAFGGWTDVVTAFLWGLGLSTAGTKLADLTVGQVRTALRPAT